MNRFRVWIQCATRAGSQEEGVGCHTEASICAGGGNWPSDGALQGRC